MTLTQYNKRRKFSGAKKTTEPKPKENNVKNMRLSAEAKKKSRPSEIRGRSARKIKGLPRFVVHKHTASHLHWDLRLEEGGVLKSWAVPKEPPTEKCIKRLAVAVEDHPLAYAKFHGTIPEGNYGAGKVEIWDKGTYELIKKNSKEIEIVFHGKKLKGKYVLIKTHYGNKPDKSWLWFKVG